MASTADAQRKLQQDADAAASAGDYVRALRLLEKAAAEQQDSAELWMKLTAMRRTAGDIAGALKAVERALALSPLDFSALLSRAMLLERLGDTRAGEAFGHALAQAPPDERIPAAMAQAIAHAREKSAEHQAKVESRLSSAIPADLDPSARARVERFVSNASRRTRHFHQEPTDFHFPGLPEIEFHERALFPELEAIEAGTDEITREYEALVASRGAEMVPYTQYPEHVPLGQWRELNNNRDWTAVHLLQNGQRIAANADRCPATMAAVAKLPQPHIPGATPNAMFSLLAPHTRIPPHTGVANTRLVCHLPLIVPPGCGFRVGATTRAWEVGKAFVFDDTIEHEAWNESGELRVVLIVDLWPPALGLAERQAVAAVISAAGVSFKGA